MAKAASSARAWTGAGRTAARAVLGQSASAVRTLTVSFAAIFAVVAYLQPVAYRHAYPTVGQRIAFAHSFASNKALILFYGKAHDLLSVGGYTAWRVGGTLAIFAAVWGALAGVRLFRRDEEAGRTEMLLTGVLGRHRLYAALLGSGLAGTACLGAATWLGLLAGGLPAGSSAYLALCVALVVPVFFGIGAVVSQLVATRRAALELALGAVGLALLLRVVGDSSSSGAWLRWLSPLGWSEAARPFTGAEPWALCLPVIAICALVAAARGLFARRDIGTGLFARRDAARPRLWLLSSPTRLTARLEATTVLVWLISLGAFAFILGSVSSTISSAGMSVQLRQSFERLGAGSVLTPKGYISYAGTFYVLAISVFVIAQMTAARREEADEELETLLALPVARPQWLAGRILLAAGGAALLALAAGLVTWVGAAAQSVHVSLPEMLAAGANCLPTAMLFLGLAALAYAWLPRASVGISYGLVIVAYLWQLFASLLGAPKIVVDLTPFAHVALMPLQSFRAGAAAVMVTGGALGAAGAVAGFRRRDLLGD